MELSVQADFLAVSDKMRRIVALAQRFSLSPSPVLILGETGTGKEFLARLVHGSRHSRPFVAIDCATLGTLLESELFGHAKGAFTGAVAEKPGLLELANGGTVFLDEIGEMPLAAQAKLLRVVEEKRIRRVGSTTWRDANFRIIAATNRELVQEVERKQFRRDLYYRLNVLTLRLPPLRERREDIPALAEFFLARSGRSWELAPELMETLRSYNWPGNVRELRNCIEYMVAMSDGPVLGHADLPSGLADSVHVPAASQQASLHMLRGGRELQHPVIPLAELERWAVLWALAATAGDKLSAARLLGIGRTTLYRKLRRFCGFFGESGFRPRSPEAPLRKSGWLWPHAGSAGSSASRQLGMFDETA